MRVIPCALLAVCLLAPRPAAAQEWIEFSSSQDLFSVNFPQQPKVETITYVSQQEAPLPGRVYTATEGQSKYSMTVIEYLLCPSVAVYTRPGSGASCCDT